jgi:hypothetical protein
MGHLLNDERELLASAMENIGALERKIQGFLDSHRGTIIFDEATDKRVVIGHLRLDAPINALKGRPEREWGIAADEIVGKMRSALDHAIYSLSEHDQDEGFHPEQSGANTQFPIFANERNYFAGNKKRKTYLAGITEEHKKVIDDFQPFRRGTMTENDKDPLLDLHGGNFRARLKQFRRGAPCQQAA